jgi:hypothetical protein
LILVIPVPNFIVYVPFMDVLQKKKLNLIAWTSWNQILEQLIVPWVIKHFCASYAIWMLIIIFTLAHHMCVSLARWIQLICSHPSFWRSGLISSDMYV